MKVVRLSALRTGRFYPPRKYSWYSFVLENKSTPGPYCGRKDYINNIIGNRTRHLPTFNAAPQPTAPPGTGAVLQESKQLVCKADRLPRSGGKFRMTGAIHALRHAPLWLAKGQTLKVTFIVALSVVFPCMLIITQLLFQQNALVY
jgi:hypothetical protein